MSSGTSMELLLPQSLDKLEVYACQKLRELPILPPSLVSLQIRDVWLTKLPMIGNISSHSIESKSSKLIDISVTDCPYLTSLEGSLLEQELHMGALCVLKVDDCTHLESASIPFEEMHELRELRIGECPKLRTTRDAKDKLVLSSLRELTIARCDDLEPPLLGSLELLVNLSTLVLQNCSSLVSLPSADVFKNLSSLWHMDIEGCENLSSFGGLGSLSSLIWFGIAGCNKLAEAAESSLTRVASGSGSGGEEEHLMEPCRSLQITSLSIDLPSLLLLEPFKSLCHTESFTINNGSEMESLPEQWLLQIRRSLHLLHIHEADSLKSLPLSMQDLCSLQYLSLTGARELQSLPYLPSSLKRLILPRCHPDLEKKVTKHGSPEWNKIAHIPYAQIGDWSFVLGKQYSVEAFTKLSSSEFERLSSKPSLQ
ncbi:unnamed protein product [Alopecurus aequalis]